MKLFASSASLQSGSCKAQGRGETTQDDGAPPATSRSNASDVREGGNEPSLGRHRNGVDMDRNHNQRFNHEILDGNLDLRQAGL